VVIGFTWGKGSLASSMRSHLTDTAPTAYFFKQPADYPIEWGLFLRHAECVLGAGAAILFAIRLKRRRELSFPTVLLCTLLVVHSVHRPWWNYYYLHFAVPLAWLCGWAVYEGVKAAWGWTRRKGFEVRSTMTWKAIALCALATAVLARSETRLEAEVRHLRDSPRINASAILARMRRYAPSTHWVCAQDVMYPFDAGLRVPPELAVIMAKRFWSGQISADEIINICRKYKPEQILLPNGERASAWSDFLKSGYKLALADRERALYVSNRLDSNKGR
jgi:hypothetical protein